MKYPEKPAVVQIETTINCNANCSFCPQKNARRRPRLMEETLFRSIVDQTRGMGILYRPFLLGEPFADPRMVEFIRYINEDETAKVDLDTNGGMLKEETAKRLLDCRIEEIRFSVDGLEDDTYKSRRGMNRAPVYENILRFLEMNARRDNPIKTRVRMIHIPGKEEEESEYKKFWQDKVDEVVITDEYRYPWDGQEEPVLLPCLKVRGQMFFYVDGTVPLCCWDTMERSCMGDAKKESVMEIWKGQRMDAHRKLLDAGRRDVITLCSRCDAYMHYDFSKEGFTGPAPDNEISELNEYIG